MKMRKFDQINVIPFIDIMLVLLVIVLTTATFVAKGVVPIDLPSASSKEAPPAKEFELTIKDNGELFYNKEKISIKVFEEKVKTIKEKDTIVVRTDKNADFKHFMAIVDVLKTHNIENISIVTEQ